MGMYLILALAITLNAVANILMKVGMLKQAETRGVIEMARAAAVNPAVLLGLVSFALALAAYLYVLSKVNLSIAYPIMTSLGYVIVIVVSWALLNENIAKIQILGFVFIIAGVWMVAK